MKNSTAYLRVHLTYKEGCGELWALKKIRTLHPMFTIVSDTPSRRLINLRVPCGREAELEALYREPWVADAWLTNKLGHRLPEGEQILRRPPESPADIVRPFPGYRR